MMQVLDDMEIAEIGTPREVITEEMLQGVYGVAANVAYDAEGLPLVDYRTGAYAS